MSRDFHPLRGLPRFTMVLAAVACLGLAPARAQSPATPSPVAAPAVAAPVVTAPAPAATPPAAPQPTAPAADNPEDTSSAIPVELKPRPTLALSGSAEWDDGLTAITASLDKLKAEMGRVGLQPGGRPMTVFVETDDKGFRYEAMIPLVAQPDPAPALGEGFRIASSPAGKTMKFEHRGSYEEIDTTYEAITAYLDEKGLEAQNLFIEEYLNAPRGPDDEDLQVDIYVFLK